ncbi:SAFB-like transcription modulator isoform X2 [Melanaphis sacchari]|uniref:SAFB-like transcription modulator isoform X2 n=1 Tax=Melanaphis sacchari TaxID=742174 RepID=UPI000DC1314D|nr:SAFB-like transcription modulator isoform X2 [Melanaphis sacchari]
MLTINSKSPSVEKKLSPVIEKNEIDTLSTSDKIKITPSKILKTNDDGKRSGSKSKTCAQQLKIEIATSNLFKKNEINPEQADSNNIDLTDTTELESKKIDIATKENYEDKVTVSLINSIHIDNNIAKMETNKIKQTKNLDDFDIGAKFKIVEKSTIIRNHLDEEKNENIIIETKEVAQVSKEESNIQDEELDHEVYVELDHEVDEEEIIQSSVKSIQEHSKDDNNEDSINLTIEEDDIKLFADEEDTDIEKEDEVIGNQTKEETSSIKHCHPVTSSRSSTGLDKSRCSATEKRLSVGDKLRSTHKEDKDISNAKPIINVSVPKDEKNEEEKLVNDKLELGNNQSDNSKAHLISNDTSKKNNSSLVRNIWVSGLSSITKATDLKQLFSKYGKVVGAKVVTNAKTPGARCYGFVTLSSAEDANRSIENLHKTELHGRVISVERAKRDNSYQVTANSSDSSKVNENFKNDQKIKKNEEKKNKPEEKREKRPEITINDVKKSNLSTNKRSSKDRHQDPKRSKIMIESDEQRKDKSIKSKSSERDKERLKELERERERLERERRKQQEILNLTKMKNEREKQRQREYERAMREEERRRRIEKERQLEIERKQKEEAIRLEKERHKLRIERERIEKEKSELLRLERENQRIERERLQREKEELRRAQAKLEETKRQALLKRSAIPQSSPIPSKRHSSSNLSRYEERKESIRNSRIQSNSDYVNQAPPPPNITTSRHRYEQRSSDARRMRPSSPPPPPPASRPKDSTVNIRYNTQLATDQHYKNRDDRSNRRNNSRRKDSNNGSSNRHANTTYDSNKSSYGMSRTNESSTWSSPVPVKSTYGTLGASPGSNNMAGNMRPDPWTHSNFQDMDPNIWQRTTQPPPSDKWNSLPSSNPPSVQISGRSSSSNTLYSNNNEVLPNVGLNMSTNFTDTRFDSYKMSGMSHKY